MRQQVPHAPSSGLLHDNPPIEQLVPPLSWRTAQARNSSTVMRVGRTTFMGGAYHAGQRGSTPVLGEKGAIG